MRDASPASPEPVGGHIRPRYAGGRPAGQQATTWAARALSHPAPPQTDAVNTAPDSAITATVPTPTTPLPADTCLPSRYMSESVVRSWRLRGSYFRAGPPRREAGPRPTGRRQTRADMAQATRGPHRPPPHSRPPLEVQNWPATAPGAPNPAFHGRLITSLPSPSPQVNIRC